MTDPAAATARRPRRARAAVAVFALGAGAASAQNLPPPPVPAGNPLTAPKALLGKALFWDEQLSSQRNVACGTCHVFATGGSDPRTAQGALAHPGPDGVPGTADDIHGSPGVARHDAMGHLVADPTFGVGLQTTGRKTPSMINAAYAVELFWDGRAATTFRDPVTGAIVLPTGGALESQIAQPPLSDVEMSHIGRSWTDIAADLAPLQPLALADQLPAALQTFVQNTTYAQLFQQVFGSPGVTPTRIIFAIASYERTLISDQSPFDLHLAGQPTLNTQERRGLFEFQGLCMQCHQDIDQSVRFTGPVLNDYRNVGVRPFTEDSGRFQVTGVIQDSGRFKVPGLRNVALRAPYFHTGGMATLTDVVDFYQRGGDFHVNQDVLVSSIPGQLSNQDKLDIVAFLQTLTDPRVAQGLPPFDRPRLWSEGANAPTVTGVGTAGTGGLVPRSLAFMPAHIGNPAVSIGLHDVPPGAAHGVALDFALNATPTVLLGQNVYLGQSPALTFLGIGFTGASTGRGYSTYRFAVPNDPGLRGVVFHGQWVVADAAGPFGLTVSDAFTVPVF